MPKFNLGWLKDKNGEKFAPKTFIKQVISETGKSLQDILDRKISSPLSAEVGQQLVVKDVDENGKPIDWEYRDVEVQEQVQADYSQNDSAQPDYIQNRPFYSYYGDVIFDENITLTYEYDNWHNGDFNTSLSFKKEQSYELNYNGKLFVFVLDDYGNVPNFMFDGMEIILSKYRIVVYKPDNLNPHITIREVNFVKINETYIPDNIPKVSSAAIGQTLEVEETDENGKPIKWKAVDKPTGGDVDLSEYVKNTDYATSNKAGVVTVPSAFGVQIYNGGLRINAATNSDVDSKNSSKPITPSNLDYALKSGLTTNSIEWTDEEKQAARDLIGASTGDGSGEGVNIFIDEDGYIVCGDEAGGSDLDVQINGTSIVENGVANIPIASNTQLGVGKTLPQAYGITVSDNIFKTVCATESDISVRGNAYKPIVPKHLDYAVKLAMCDGKGAEWTSEEKASARERMGASGGSVGKFIGEVTIDNDETRLIEWTECADGSPLDFDELFIMCEGMADSTRNLCFTVNNEYECSAYNWSAESSASLVADKVGYMTSHFRMIGGQWIELGYTKNTAVYGTNVLRPYNPVEKGTQRCTTSLIVGIGWGHFVNGAKIAVYGR